MGIEGDRRKLKKKIGYEFSGNQLQLIRKLVRSEGIDLIEAGNKILNELKDSDEDLLKQLNSFGEVNYIDWENDNTKKVVSEIFTSKISYQSRDFRKYLESIGESTKLVYRDTANTFFNIIHRIEDNRLFWVIFGWFFQQYELTSIRLKDFENCITEERLQVGFYQRCLLGNLLQTVNEFFRTVDKDSLSFHSIDEAKQKIINNTETNEQFFRILHRRKEFNNLVEKNNDEEIKLYRGFKVDIRDREKRILDKENNKQLMGQGLSYSLDKDRCIYFSTRWSNFDTFTRILHTMKEFSEQDGSNIEDNNLYEMMREVGFNYNQFFNDKKYRDEFLSSKEFQYFVEDFLSYENKNGFTDTKNSLNEIENYDKQNTRGYIGEYTCLKKDIVFYSDFNNEKEVVVKTSDSKMKNYKVVTFSKVMNNLKDTMIV